MSPGTISLCLCDTSGTLNFSPLKMKFNLPAMETDPQGQQYPVYYPHSSSSSSTYTHFTEQGIRAGFPSGNYGGGRRGPEMYRGRLEMREAIQCELEKEMIREKIIAEEIVRRRIWEADQAMRSGDGGGFSSPFMPFAPPRSNNNLLEPRLFHRQPIEEKRFIMSIDENYAHGGHPRENPGFDIRPFQRFAHSPKIQRSYHSG